MIMMIEQFWSEEKILNNLWMTRWKFCGDYSIALFLRFCLSLMKGSVKFHTIRRSSKKHVGRCFLQLIISLITSIIESICDKHILPYLQLFVRSKSVVSKVCAAAHWCAVEIFSKCHEPYAVCGFGHGLPSRCAVGQKSLGNTDLNQSIDNIFVDGLQWEIMNFILSNIDSKNDE